MNTLKICRFTYKNDPKREPRVGLLESDRIQDVTPATDELPGVRWPLPMGDQFIAELPRLRPHIERVASRTEPISRDKVSLLSPVANPGKIICGAGNWRHAEIPMGTHGALYKTTSALAGESDGVQIRWLDRVTVYEPELAWVIGRECTNISEGEALDCIAGFTCGLDMTLNHPAERREFFSFCKSFDTYGVLGPALVTTDEVGDPSTLEMKLWLNGELKEEWSFEQLAANPARLTAYLSTATTLYPGDVILSGAPNVGPVKPGDVMVMQIPRIGEMTVAVSTSPHTRSESAEPA